MGQQILNSTPLVDDNPYRDLDVLNRRRPAPGYQSKFPSRDVIGVPVHVVTGRSLSEALVVLLRSGARGWISYVNVHAANLAHCLPWFKRFLRESMINYADGEGVRFGALMLGSPLPERIVMTDWLYDVCNLAQEHRFRVFFLGTKEVIIERAVARLQDLYSHLSVAGYHHGFFDDDEAVVSIINHSYADILIIGMGMPLQERWILENHQQLDVQVILNAGSCFDFVAGSKRRCPRWMADHGMEWVFRLFQEPRRLWKRYLIGIPLFVFRVLRQRMGKVSRDDGESG